MLREFSSRRVHRLENSRNVSGEERSGLWNRFLAARAASLPIKFPEWVGYWGCPATLRGGSRTFLRPVAQGHGDAPSYNCLLLARFPKIG